MRLLEVRRHTHRHSPAPHVSQHGVTLARQVGAGLGQFDRVVTSTLPRAFETAIAIGYAVDEQLEQLSQMNDAVDAEIQWNAGFAAWADVVKRGGAAARFAHDQAELWRSIVRTLPAGGRVLIITHGGIVEAGTIGCLPPDTPVDDEAFCGLCEGVRLTFEGETVAAIEFVRVAQRSS
ncbi:putative phosphoglycerate mutase [Thermoflexales bacterium]|nr:putative phosphoglycerate mutase [Thermoflexales bacterium]